MALLNTTNSTKAGIASVVDETLVTKDVDITNCDREPIHLSNEIQPHGILLTFNPKDAIVQQVSNNIEVMIGVSPESILGHPLSTVFSSEHIDSIHQHLLNADRFTRPLQLCFTQDENKQLFIGTLHQADDVVILELEHVSSEQELSFFDFYETIKAPVERLQRTENLEQLCQVVVEEIHRLTQFDRVMVYQFHPDGSGSIIAEQMEEGTDSYKGLRYPATDIPKQAKQLYTLHWLRTIPRIDYKPVSLIPEINPLTDRPLDMSASILRSVSPLHVEYLKNMGVNASMSISLLRDRKLWGLIACHHNQSKMVNFALRNCCEFLGQIVSSELAAKERQENLSYRVKVDLLLSTLRESMANSAQLLDGLTQFPNQLIELVRADGVALIQQETITMLGTTPSESNIQALLPFIETELEDRSIFYTHMLSQVQPEALEFKETACGLLALSISRTQQIYLLWFRPELMQSIDWAGNPNKPKEIDEQGEVTLSPRQSFEKWSETVHLQSQPWKSVEIEAALELRHDIISHVLQKADELAQVNAELERSNDELASFAYVASHDLKSPLRAIANLACWIQDDLGDAVPEESQRYLQLLQSRVNRMEEMINGLLEYSRVGNQEASLSEIDLTRLLQEITDSLSPPETFQISIPSQTPALFSSEVLLKQVFSNLLSNAMKYMDRPDGRIEVVVTNLGKEIQFEVKDNGPGIEPRYHQNIFKIFQTLNSRDKVESTGIGLAIVKKVVESQGGEITVSSALGEGSNFIFTWPKHEL